MVPTSGSYSSLEHQQLLSPQGRDDTKVRSGHGEGSNTAAVMLALEALPVWAAQPHRVQAALVREGDNSESDSELGDFDIPVLVWRKLKQFLIGFSKHFKQACGVRISSGASREHRAHSFG
jgi:hypothetical protein